MYVKFFKRIIDIVIALLGIILLFIPFLLIAIVIKIDSPGKIIFSQKRCGRNRKSFYILKLRTMPKDFPKYVATNELTYKKDDFTKLEQILRKTSIDELPQLLNILKGDMSFIGPRPVICEEENLINEREKYGINSLRPGLTGWAQINGRDNLDYMSKAQYDREYFEKVCFTFDVKCFFLSIDKVLTHDGFNDNIHN